MTVVLFAYESCLQPPVIFLELMSPESSAVSWFCVRQTPTAFQAKQLTVQSCKPEQNLRTFKEGFLTTSKGHESFTPRLESLVEFYSFLSSFYPVPLKPVSFGEHSVDPAVITACEAIWQSVR